jgi:lysophospholipase L1-like esterase
MVNKVSILTPQSSGLGLVDRSDLSTLSTAINALIDDSTTTTSAIHLPKTRAAIAKVRAGVSDGKVIVIGDSTVYGQGAGTGSGAVGARALSSPVNLAKLLTTRGIPANSEEIHCPYPGSGDTVPQYDPRISLGSFIVDTTLSTLSGYAFRANGAYTLALTPVAAFDSVDIYYIQGSSGSTFTVNVDGGATLKSVNSNGSNALAKTTVTGITRGTHTLNIVAVGATVWIVGIVPHDSQNPSLSVMNFGWIGAKSSTFLASSSAWSAANCWPIWAPDLVIVNLTINDINSGTPAATFAANMKQMLTSIHSAGSDIMLVIGHPIGTANGANYEYIVEQANSLAETFNAPIINLIDAYQSYAYWNTIIPYYDTLHFTAQGYWDEASRIAELFNDIH